MSITDNCNDLIKHVGFVVTDSQGLRRQIKEKDDLISRLRSEMIELRARMVKAEKNTELERLREEIQVLRCLEDSYEIEGEVLAKIFLKLNQLCNR